VVVVVVAGLAVLVPVLIHGRVIGETDILSHYGVTKQPGVAGHIYQNADVADSLIPWSYTVWQQVHHGHLPLWNPFAGLGMPLAFNWQSAPFSLSSLVGYLVPVRDALTTGVVVDVIVAGTGGYVLGRVLGMSKVASASVGIVFELSGPFVAWFGYPFPSVIGWSGWIFALGILILRQRHRAGLIVALAVAVAFSLYGGAPEGFLVVLFSAAVFFTYVLLRRARWLGGNGPIFRPALDLIVATVAGCALAAPFALPGFQLASKSVRSLGGVEGATHLHAILYLALPAFDGLPIFHGGRVEVLSYGLFYTETAMYVGVIALVLAGIALVVARRNARVQALAVVVILCLALVFVSPVDHLVARIPVVDRVGGLRALMPMVLALAVLAGYGMDIVVRDRRLWRGGRRLAVGFGVALLLLLLLWSIGRGHLSPVVTSIRAHSFIWPAVEIVLGGVAAGFLLYVGRRRERPGSGHDHLGRWAGPVAGIWLLVAEAVFLISMGATMMQSSTQLYPQTPASRALARTVGSRTVAMASTICGLGLDPNTNDEYGVSELEVYDPIVPKAFFADWTHDTGTPAGIHLYNLFCPAVASAAVAREFGVSYLVQADGQPAPTGTTYVERLGDENLYRVPGAGAATVVATTSSRLPPFGDAGKAVPVTHPSPSEWVVRTNSASRAVLRLHLSNVPGWHATIDGRPLNLQPYGGMMLQAVIPPGNHVIVVHYWPTMLTVGIVLASLAAMFLIGLLVLASMRRRGVGLRRRSAAAASTASNDTR
jgi:hypothetical protein